jgi:hypothetical protein
MPTAHSPRLSRARDRPLVGDPRRLDGIDMRTRAGQRYRQVVEALVAEFGSANKIALRELAGLRFALEQTQAAIVAGDTKARTDLVRISNLVARRERELRQSSAVAAAKSPAVTLHERLAARYAPAVKGGTP